MAPDCVIAFSFGNRRQHHAVLPGPINVSLAELLIQDFPGVPKILQWEIHVAYGALVDHDENSISIDRNTSRPGRYLDTRNIAEQAVHLMESHGWVTAAVVAHGDHYPRAVACCRKLGIDVITTPPGPDIYDSESGQLWTRSRRIFATHELIANALYRLFGYR